ncbi:MAG: hypothetical protein J7502_09525 [Flavisolibacter sp.]|nr:hypothetical protein [Flavisolibacter sp.]
MKKVLLLLAVVTTLNVSAQNVVGYWYGTANVAGMSSTNNYMIELIVTQKQSAVQAIMNCYFKNTFRSIKLNGNYNNIKRELTLLDIPMPYFASTDKVQVDCQMEFTASHRVAKAGSNLTGRFTGLGDYKYTCPDIVFDLKLNNEAGNQDSILLALKNFKETYQLWTPSATDTIVQATVIQRKIENPVIKREFAERENVIQKVIEVDSDSITIDLYDNGEVDGDSVSVFFNGELLGANLMLSTRSIRMNIKLDTTREFNELSMFANNLGAIPPNTALMLVSDGKTRYEVRLSSNLEKTGAVRIRRKKAASLSR